MRAYKATDINLTCRGYQFEVGKSYKHDGVLKLCESGFHFCRQLGNCFDYYDFDEKQTRVLEIEVKGEYIGKSESKECTNEFAVIRELNWQEVQALSNSGHSNSGHSNSGHRNSGHRNSGHWNSGHWNSGNWNSGDRNSGDSNSGDWNSGHRNSGNWNSGNWNSGNLNTTKPDKIRIFNIWLESEEAERIIYPNFFYFDLTVWVSHDTATTEEKKTYKTEIETCGGFLKKIEYKEAFRLSYEKATKEDQEKVKQIPGFNSDLFYEISGIIVK